MILLEVDWPAATLTQATSRSPNEPGRFAPTGLLWGQNNFRNCVVLEDGTDEFRN